MKITVELPESLFQSAKAAAAEQGTTFEDYFAEAVRGQLQRRSGVSPVGKSWQNAFGGLRDLHRENRRIERLIAAEFETIEERR